MDIKLMNKFKFILENIKQELLTNTQSLAIDRSTQKDDIKDEGDIAVNEINNGMVMRLNNRENLYLKKIIQALDRINKGEFGNCLECGDTIGIKRLFARPTAEMCINCKEDHERRENLSIDGKKAKSLGTLMRFN